MFFDDSKPPTTIIMYEKSLPCGALGMSPHVVSSSGMLQVDLVETDHDLQNSMIDDQHMNHSSRLEHYQDQPVYHPYHDSSNGKRSGDEEFGFQQEKRPRLMMLNSFHDSSVITVDCRGRSSSMEDEDENDDDDGGHGFCGSHFCTNVVGVALPGDDSSMPDCSTSGGDLGDSLMLRDFPHPRHVCVMFPFTSPPCLSNSSHCNKCWCYSCEEVAPCLLWGTGLHKTDHCNATVSSWLWLKNKVQQNESSSVDEATAGGLMTTSVSARPSSMSGFSHGLYGPASFCSLPLCGSLEDADNCPLTLHEESADTDSCFPSCSPTSSIAFAHSRPRSDPSTDSHCFEFGTIQIPLKTRYSDKSLEDLMTAFDKFSLELFAHTLGDQGKPTQLQYVQVMARDAASLSKYHALVDELLLNEAQGQLQVIVSVIPECEFAAVGSAQVRTFLRKDRVDDVLVLREILATLFPDADGLLTHLERVDELRRWAETSDEWTTFAGLLRDLKSNDYDEASQPIGLTVPLRPYQRQSLQFMLDAEQTDGGLLSVNYRMLPPAPSGTGLSLLYSGSLNHLIADDDRRLDGAGAALSSDVRGGFLCEEMGLGKTIEILALILANPCPLDQCAPGSSKGTLVVCPVSIVGQWANEVKSKLAANLSIYMYHGSKRIRDPKKLAKFDIVITTYATLGSDFSKATQATRHGSGFAEQFCPLLTVNWWRVVLDESHTVKDPAPLHSRACARLQADRRWCCTGTPINTSIYDLYGQFLFLKLEPLDNKSTFRKRIGRPYERQCKSDDQTVLLWTLNKIMIRHTKQQKFNGRELLRLPPKTEQDIAVTFTTDERRAYEAVYQHVIHKFEQFRCWGPTVVSKNILQIMSLLLPLRRLCSGGFVSHFELSMSKQDVGSSPAGPSDPLPGALPLSPTLETPPDNMEGECGICFELMECPTKTPCGHWFCCECVMSSLGTGSQGVCSVCASPVAASQLVTPPPKQKLAALIPLMDPASVTSPTRSANSSEDAGDPAQGVHINSKLKTLLADLTKVREEHDGAKVLIFSQFMQTIAWLKTEFKKQGINYRFISGDMPMKKRAQAIEAFQKDPPTTVFLLSIRTGAVGITLTAASHVYMLEPCLNPALEEQAVGRCWRMGQERPVVIKRLYVEKSVEANILKLLRSRVSSASTTASQAANSTNRPAKNSKNGVADVAGCIRTDKQNLRLNEFEILFS
ncbi:unnamed protein product [Sphagnum troendelagicum]|uniref:DNA repair protein RAD5 n=1 Tax=Sphagnum troendelagicum TaxID=128251 RepID=A0ABP0UN25_9BRYO